MHRGDRLGGELVLFLKSSCLFPKQRAAAEWRRVEWKTRDIWSAESNIEG